MAEEADLKTVLDRIRQFTFLLRGEISTASILSEFISESTDRRSAEYGQTLTRSIRNITAILSEFESNYRQTKASVENQVNMPVPEKITEPQNPTLNKNAKKSPEILVVEDNTVNQLLVRRLLERMGYKVTAVGSGEDAVETAQSQNFDLILMDITLPGNDGYETTRILKQIKSTQHIPVVALSAHSQESDKLIARNVGMKAYLTKPVDIKALSSVLGSLLSD